MTQSTEPKTARNRYPDEFREHALALRIGVAKAARELKLHDSRPRGNNQQYASIRTQSRENTRSRLLAVREAARNEKKPQFTNLFHLVSEALLRQSFYQLKRQSAPGCDGVTWERYAENVQSHLTQCAPWQASAGTIQANAGKAGPDKMELKGR